MSGNLDGRHLRRVSVLAVAMGLLLGSSAHADWTTCATSWSNFNNPGFIFDYTYKGEKIRDYETSADPSHGPAAVPPDETDLASGSPSSFPGAYATPAFGYYDGGTPWNPTDPSTLEDDFILFRMRVRGDPTAQQGDFSAYHWNVLLDVDGDGYKEFWVDLEGSCSGGSCSPPTGGTDRLNILFNDDNRQDIPDPDATRVNYFSASTLPLAGGGCTGTSPGRSHTRVIAANDGTGDYWIEVQVPMTAFNDLAGNQVLFPDSPVAFVFSTSASNTNPLQKDFMMDLKYLSLNDPIQFGDVVTPSGLPKIDFTDADQATVNYYAAGSDVFIFLTDPIYNNTAERRATVDCIMVTVTDPATGDDEQVQLCETAPSSGIFTNEGGRSYPGGQIDGTGQCVQLTPFPPTPAPTAWFDALQTSLSTIDETWTLTFQTGRTWGVAGSVSGSQTNTATAGEGNQNPVFYSSSSLPGAPRVSFNLYQENPPGGSTLSFCTRAADRLPTSTISGGSDNDGTLRVNPGDTIYVSYTNRNAYTVTDQVPILGSCQALVQFTRADGRASENFTLTNDIATSDKLYVTVTHLEANTNPATVQTITVTLTGYDTQTLTLTETGPNTGVFRNTTGLNTRISDGVETANDDLWEDVDSGTPTATYVYDCGGSSLTVSATASIFANPGGGRVFFVNGAGTQDVTLYTAGEPVFVKVEDPTYACAGPVQVTITSASGDSETVTVYPTATGSGVYMNRRNDLVTTAGSAAVTSASSTFIADGVPVGGMFVIATGPDAGNYTVASVDSQTQITLNRSLTSSRTAISFNALPLVTAVFDGTATSNDGVLEAAHDDTLTASYVDCNDGDTDATNNTKTDTARFNAPGLVINRVLFNADPAGCQTEFVEIYNPTTTMITATGYRIVDEDGQLDYTIPEFAGADLILQPGQRIIVSFGGYYPDFAYGSIYYLFQRSDVAPFPPYPSNFLAGPSDADPADQVTLYNGSGVAIDYVGWSATTAPSLDFLSDDTAAVLRSIWQDDSFKSISSLAVGYALTRSSDGFDTNTPTDWQAVLDNTCQGIIDAYAATRATIRGLRVDPAGGVIEFATGGQNGTVSFDLFGTNDRRGSGVRRRLNDVPVPAPVRDSTWPITYRAETLPMTERYLLIEELEVTGERRLMGPFSVDDERLRAAFERIEHRLSLHGVTPDGRRGRGERLDRARPDGTHHDLRARQRRWPRGPAVGGIKIQVRGPGRVQVPIGEALPAGPSRLAAARALRLTHLGRDVPFSTQMTSTGPVLVFQAEGFATDYGDRDTYVLTWGRSAPPPAVPLTRTGDPPVPGFTRVERSTTYLGSAPLDEDPWKWDFLWGDGSTWPYAWWDPTHGQFDLPQLAAARTGDATVRIRLLGWTAHTHTVTAWINGIPVGELTFEGRTAAVLEGAVPLQALRRVGNELTMTYASSGPDPADVGWAYLDFVDLAIPTEPSLQVRPAESVEPFDPSIPSFRGVDYLILSHGEFLEEAADLARLKRTEGLNALVVDVERAYDRYSAGFVEARAIQALIRRAALSRSLKYVLLLGDDTFDPADHMGTGAASYVPSLLGWDGAFGRVPSENQYADVDDDGLPDLAIGRLPVQTQEEARVVVAKVAGQATALSSVAGRHLIVVDNKNSWDPDFGQDAARIAARLPHGASVAWASLSEGAAKARADLRDGLRNGAMLVHYIGHGGPETWADEGLLYSHEAAEVVSGTAPMVLLSWTCQVQWYLYLWGRSVNEALLLAPDGGAVAAFGPAGVTVTTAQRALYERFYDILEEEGLPLGEVIRRAKRGALEASPQNQPAVEGWNLIGDPALVLPRP